VLIESAVKLAKNSLQYGIRNVIMYYITICNASLIVANIEQSVQRLAADWMAEGSEFESR
jgi:hypothetical protein